MLNANYRIYLLETVPLAWDSASCVQTSGTSGTPRQYKKSIK